MSKQVRQSVARKAATIPITCGLDNQAHYVTKNSMTAGNASASTRRYAGISCPQPH